VTPYILTFAVICIALSFGLQKRSPWMWYFGWAFFYLFAAYFGQWFFAALYTAEKVSDLGYSLVYLCGGLVLWMPATIWWAKKKSYFISVRKTPVSQMPRSDESKPT
jgi:hypothetical protein